MIDQKTQLLALVDQLSFEIDAALALEAAVAGLEQDPSNHRMRDGVVRIAQHHASRLADIHKELDEQRRGVAHG